jgi:hypothetical protein
MPHYRFGPGKAHSNLGMCVARVAFRISGGDARANDLAVRSNVHHEHHIGLVDGGIVCLGWKWQSEASPSHLRVDLQGPRRRRQ